MQQYAFPRPIVVKACFLSDYRDCVYLHDMPSALLFLTYPRLLLRCIMGRRPVRERGGYVSSLSAQPRKRLYHRVPQARFGIDLLVAL